MTEAHVTKKYIPRATLLGLPRELRDQIYKNLLKSTRLLSGIRCSVIGNNSSDARRMIPRKNSLAILRTCRQITAEIGSSWLALVTFRFEEVIAMVDKLWPLPRKSISQIRYVTVVASQHTVARQIRYGVQFSVAEALGLLPALNLDRLVVFGPLDRCAKYDHIDKIFSSKGWRELHCYIHQAVWLTSYRGEAPSRDSGPVSPPRPFNWTKALLDNEKDCRCSIDIYRSTHSSLGSVFNPAKRKKFEHTYDEPGNDQDWIGIWNEFLMKEDFGGDELLVIAKRSPDAIITKGGQPEGNWSTGRSLLDHHWLIAGDPAKVPIEEDMYSSTEEVPPHGFIDRRTSGGFRWFPGW
jgi:hypothetical protein